MKRIKLLLPLFFLIISAVSAADYKSLKKKPSFLSGHEDVYNQFDEYDRFDNIQTYEPSGAIISDNYTADDGTQSRPESVQSLAGQEVINYLENNLLKNSKYTPSKWLQKDSANLKIEVSTQNPSQQPDLPPGLLTRLPFESQLSLSGRKLIGFDYKTRVYDKPEDGKRKNDSTFTMQQELQMRIMGKVGNRLAINVDYDDTTDKKDISLVYNGLPQEFIQEAAFGDINVSLPSTEFLSYSKELFGLKVNTRYKNFATNMFFSKTKGSSEMKRYTGNKQLQRMTIADTSYIKYKYYSILKSGVSKTIKAGSAQVYADYQKLDPKYNLSITTGTPLGYLKSPASPSYRGNFVLLVAGQDYTIDYNTGVLTFKNTLASNYVVAVDYQYTDNTWLHDDDPAFASYPVVIKDVNNTDALSQELKTFYNLGNLKIIRDDGRGNFILELKDLNGDAPSIIDGGNPVPKYPPQGGYAANINVDFENGIFNLTPVDGEPLHPSLYVSNEHKYNFITEYQYTAKILTLRPGIVPQSEKVVVDGRTLMQSSDYIIDYDLGILTILNEGIIHESSVIDVSYDYSMFGTESESTLVGARSVLNIADNITAGAGLLYNFTAKGNSLPDVRSTPNSLLVGEGDLRITDYDLDMLNMRVNLGAEYAFSSQNDNTAGKALIESMDNSVSENLASMINENWFHSANAASVVQRFLSDLSWESREIPIKDIDPELEIIRDQKQLVVDINYNVTARSEVAFAQKISNSGLDFSKKLYIDVWVNYNGSTTAAFAIDYAGSINEDADGNGLLDTEDKDGNGIISPWEDIGQQWRNPDTSISLIGAHNGKLDTEDLNGNGLLDTTEDVAGTFYLSAGTVIKENANGWKQIRIPLNITPANMQNWKNIKIVRFRAIQNLGEQGRISIGKISITGNKWEQDGVSSQDYAISSIGQSDLNYVSLLNNSYYRDLYDIEGSVRKNEQALKIDYNLTGLNENALVKTVYTGDYLDISKYDSIRFFVYAKDAAVGDVIVFRAGGNDGNYFEYKVTKDADPSWNTWKLITINQTGASRATAWSSSDPAGIISTAGMPSLEKVSQLTVGVESSAAGAHNIWFKEIHLKGSKTLDGAAWKLNGTLRWNGNRSLGAVTAGMARKSIDRNFQTITAGVYNRDYLEDSAYVNFEGVKTDVLTLLPVSAGLSRVRTITPAVMENNSNLISLNDEGKVVSYTGYANTNLNLGVDLPQVSAQYSRSIIDTSKIERLEDRETVSGNVVYNNPLEFPLLPENVTANVRRTNSYYKVYPDTPVPTSNDFLGLSSINDYLGITDYHTLEQSDSFSIKLPFRFSQGITFSPSYLIDNVSEKNRDFAEEIDYNKTLNQTIGASLVFGVANWFAPTFTYSVNTKENYNINASTNTANLIIPGQKKYIERNGVGEISWNLNAYDIASLPYFKSLTFSALFRVQDSDSYDNVSKDFRSTGFTMDKIWIRDNPLLEILPAYSTSSYIVKTISKRNDIRILGRYMPFEAFKFKGYLSPINTITANFTYTQGSENSYITGTMTDVYTKIWPELLIGMSGIEKFFGGAKWISDTQINFKYSDKDMTTFGVSYVDNTMVGFDYRFKILKKLDLYVSLEQSDAGETNYANLSPLSSGFARKWAGQGGYDLGKWRFSLRYENENNWQKNSRDIFSSKVVKQSYLGQINADMSFPGGIKLPLINLNIPLNNRIIFLSNIKYIAQESAINVETDNNANYGIAANADYEVSKYFRFLLGISYDRFEYTYNPDLNYYDLAFSSKLTIQF
ncbi:hypothetical protein [Endomicrobium proavitum]|uniref:Gliding motility protein SprA N-terminal domain-containing protein n=1 Tax=Endomicrobium proavitum TaxID=1408281 RepID=A0A0G3WK77_9BACT|nr:hypothetical protein [Endomicrobium proavitum]AKL97904.1 exported protein of unknown function [Endomicrobium proavitum]